MKNYTINATEAVLMVIDIQERLLPVMKYADKVIDNTNVLIMTAKALDIPVIITEQYPKGLGKTAEKIKENSDGFNVYEKMTFTAYTDEVAKALSSMGRKKIIITGMETHVCVYQTVRDLCLAGYDVFVAGDAVCSRSKDNYRNGLSLMSEIGAVVTNTETIFFDLLKISGTPIFKELSKLIK